MSDFDEDFLSETPVAESEAVQYTLPDVKKWRSSRFYDYENTIFDYEQIEELNKTIQKARLALFKITDEINKYERAEIVAKTKYEREWRRAYLNSNERTESMKKARADLLCEELENEAIVYGQLHSELNRLSASVRLELQTLQGLGNNLRQQIKME